MTKVFIAWSGENKEIARRISLLLSGDEVYSPIVGGENATKMTVADQIVSQMDSCNLAILLVEGFLSSRSDGTDTGKIKAVSGNIMFEWGYLLHKLADPTKICGYLFNTKSIELPSDVAGCWVVEMNKATLTDEEQKSAEFDRLATEIVKDFKQRMEKRISQTDKLHYLDTWEENKHKILNFNNSEPIAELLLYGMQATIYSGSYERLLTKAETILRSGYPLSSDLKSVIRCCMAVLKVFSVTKRLTVPLNFDDYDSLATDLLVEYETQISDKSLAAWCKIFRYDKLELCTEYYAGGLTDKAEKTDYLCDAIELSKTVISLLDEQTAANPADRQYALLYYAFATRNLYLMYSKLSEMYPENSEYSEKLRFYCNATLEHRQQLFKHYREVRDDKCLTMHYITQEYVLAMSENAVFETDPRKRKELERKIKHHFAVWEEKARITNMIFDTAKRGLEANGFTV